MLLLVRDYYDYDRATFGVMEGELNWSSADARDMAGHMLYQILRND